eukprot:5451256-Alexandrium_andersonii.AAC.1
MLCCIGVVVALEIAHNAVHEHALASSEFTIATPPRSVVSFRVVVREFASPAMCEFASPAM